MSKNVGWETCREEITWGYTCGCEDDGQIISSEINNVTVVTHFFMFVQLSRKP
jgi:hypothetical protein